VTEVLVLSEADVAALLDLDERWRWDYSSRKRLPKKRSRTSTAN